MIDAIFRAIIYSFAHILEFIIVMGFVGFILILPFLLNGGWILGILIYGYIVGVIIAAFKDKSNGDNDLSKRN